MFLKEVIKLYNILNITKLTKILKNYNYLLRDINYYVTLFRFIFSTLGDFTLLHIRK